MAKDKIYHVVWYLVPKGSKGEGLSDMSKYDHCFSEDIHDFDNVSGSHIATKSKNYFFSITYSRKEISDVIGNHDVVIQVNDDNDSTYMFYYTKEELIEEWEKTM